MIRIRTLTAAVALALGTVAPFAVQPAYAAHPVVTKTSSTSTTLSIEGTNFGSGVTSVLLGSFGPLPSFGNRRRYWCHASGGLTAGNALSVQSATGTTLG
jgi:hypothetical protein